MQNKLKGINEKLEDLEKPLGALEGLEMKANLPKQKDKDKEIKATGILKDVFKTKPFYETKTSIAITIRNDQLESINKICEITRKNRSEFIRELLDAAIDSIDI